MSVCELRGIRKIGNCARHQIYCEDGCLGIGFSINLLLLNHYELCQGRYDKIPLHMCGFVNNQNY